MLVKARHIEVEQYLLRPKLQCWGLKMQGPPILPCIERGAGGEKKRQHESKARYLDFISVIQTLKYERKNIHV